jgi:hypothetical protein
MGKVKGAARWYGAIFGDEANEKMRPLSLRRKVADCSRTNCGSRKCFRSAMLAAELLLRQRSLLLRLGVRQ